MSLNRVIAVAEGEMGYTETGNNITKYWQEYDPSFQGQPWCVAFLWWCFKHGGEESAFFGGGKTASCGILLRWYRAMGQTVYITQVQPGDIVILNFSGTKDTEHCGLVTEVGWISHGVVGLIKTIEGNTSVSGSQSNGGEVCLKVRYPRQIVAVCRPHYKPKEEPMKDDITGHWAEKAIRWELDAGISNGYPDGSYKPDQPVTRAEDATKLYRFCEVLEAEISELRKEIARLKEAIK